MNYIKKVGNRKKKIYWDLIYIMADMGSYKRFGSMEQRVRMQQICHTTLKNGLKWWRNCRVPLIYFPMLALMSAGLGMRMDLQGTLHGLPSIGHCSQSGMEIMLGKCLSIQANLILFFFDIYIYLKWW